MMTEFNQLYRLKPTFSEDFEVFKSDYHESKI